MNPLSAISVSVPYIALIAFLPYLIPVCMPSFRALAICVVLIGGFFAYIWINEWIVENRPDYNEGPGGALGIAIVLFASAGFAIGVAVRAASLWLASAQWPRTGIILNFAGFIAVIGVFVVPVLWRAWQQRPVSAACATARFSLQIAGARLRVPASPLFDVYLGPSVRRDARYLSITPDLRALCASTENGGRTVRATHVHLGLGYSHSFHDMKCTDAAAVMGANACEAFALIQRGLIDQTDYPTRVDVFAPDEVNMGEFGATRSTYEDASKGTRGTLFSEFFRAGQLLPDGTPLTLACQKINSRYHCHVSYRWHDGAHINYAFNAASDDVVAKGGRVDARVRQLFDAMIAAP